MNMTPTKLEEWLMDIETAADLTNESQAKLPRAKLRELTHTGGSHLSHTVAKPDSHLAQIFSAKFHCIIKLIIIIG